MNAPAPSGVEFTPAADPAADGTLFACPLCGGRFTHGAQVCGGCPLAHGCDVVQCPHCGHQFPRSSRIVDWLGRMGVWLRGKA